MYEQIRRVGKAIANRSLQVIAVMVVLPVAACQAQAIADACMPTNDLYFNFNQIVDPSGKIIELEMDPIVWAPGKTYTVSLENGFPVQTYSWMGPSGCPDVTISAWQWPDAPNPYEVGAMSQDVALSNLTYVNPTLSTYSVTVSGSAQSGEHVFFQMVSTFGVTFYWNVQIQSPPPPPPPSPPQKNNCPVPTITGVTPDTWIAGKTYPITVTGTGFITAANATDSCPISVITVSVNTGTVTLSNVTVVDSTTITAKVTPAGTDPEEPAEVILWAPYNVLDDDDDVEGDSDLLPHSDRRPQGSTQSGYIEIARSAVRLGNRRDFAGTKRKSR